MQQLTFGKFTLTWLDGGVTHLDGGAMFGVVPKALWSRKYVANEKNQVELRTDPILLQTGNRHILIESGIGIEKLTEKQKRHFGVTEQSNIDRSLHELGLTTRDIDTVLMTHMHFDHACGLTKWEGDQLIPTFERADIYVSEVEWDEMRHPNIRSRNTYWESNWKPIAEQVVTFKQELEITPGVTMIHTGGHSAGHSIITIEQEGEWLIHMADNMATHAHKNVLWVMAYDDYPMTSIAQKQKWMTFGQQRRAWYTFYHDAVYRALKWDENGEVLDAIPRT